MERIQKLLAGAGVGSRRAVESWIAEGRITVNGRPAEIGQKISATDRVLVDGRPIRLPGKDLTPRALLYKKRVGELVTRDDPEGRRTVFRKLPRLDTGRWIAVGRLDINTSGVLLMTNDGELARRLTHPSFQITREYAVRVLGEVDDALLQRLRDSVDLDDGPARFDHIEAGGELDGETTPAANRWFHVTLLQGRNRLVRRLFESQGLQVSRLIRTAYGPIRLRGGQRSGTARELDAEELGLLQGAVGLEPSAPTRRSHAKFTAGAARDDSAQSKPSANPALRARPGPAVGPASASQHVSPWPKGRSARKTGH